VGDEQNPDKKLERKIFIIALAPMLTVVLLEIIASFIQSAIPGSLYDFPLFYPLRKATAFVFAIGFILNFILAAVYIKGINKSRWILRFLVTMWIVLLFYLLSFGLSYGHVDEAGLRYALPRTFFQSEKFLWSQVDRPAELEISYVSGRNICNYTSVLKVVGKSGNNPIEFSIPFTSNRDHKALPVVLKVIRQQQIQVTTHFRDRELAAMSSDPKKVELLREIKALTKVE